MLSTLRKPSGPVRLTQTRLCVLRSCHISKLQAGSLSITPHNDLEKCDLPISKSLQYLDIFTSVHTSEHQTSGPKKRRTLFSRTESRSLSELTRQITPPTKNGHAPPPTESRKSYQSVNPSSVRAWWDFPCWVKLSHRLHSWWCPSVNFFKFLLSYLQVSYFSFWVSYFFSEGNNTTFWYNFWGVFHFFGHLW